MRAGLLQKTFFWGIRGWHLLAMFAIYCFFGFQYWLALWVTSGFRYNIWKELLIDYFFLKILLTAPLWWLYFVHWKNKPLPFKLAFHLVTGPAWVLTWFVAYRGIQDLRGGRYLTGLGSWWDIYIPFLVYCVQFSLFHVYDYYLKNQQQRAREAALLQAAHASEVNALKAQLQPHFLYNTLNSISASVPAEMEHTRELIAKLADTFRYGLKASEAEWVTLQEELDFVHTTLMLEKERLQSRLNITYDIDENLLSLPVPPLLLQPVTENAIKHGIAINKEGGVLSICVKQVGEKAAITIADTGPGFNGTPVSHLLEKGIGLKNLRLRLDKLYGEPLEITSNHPSGMQVRFYVPLRQQ